MAKHELGQTVETSSGSRILVVDDEQDIVTIIKHILERSGYHVDAYSDPLQALEAFRPGKYDLCLFDFRMPRMNGLELYQCVAVIDPTVKVCFISANVSVPEQVHLELPNLDLAKCFISKPVSPSGLVQAIERILCV